MSLTVTALLIEEIRYFDKKQTRLPLTDNRILNLLINRFVGYSCDGLPICLYSTTERHIGSPSHE